MPTHLHLAIWATSRASTPPARRALRRQKRKYVSWSKNDLQEKELGDRNNMVVEMDEDIHFLRSLGYGMATATRQ
eukprot:2964676-Amphidinium_carterae.2